MPFEITRPIETLRAQAIARINAKAGEIITARLPQYKQANLTARAVELNHRATDLWTPEERAEWAAIQAEWEWIQSIRANSNAAVDNVNAAVSPSQIRTAEHDFIGKEKK